MRDAGQLTPLRPTQVERIVHYYHYVRERAQMDAGPPVTSQEIAAWAHLDASLVRKDLAAIGVRGSRRVGYRPAAIVAAIRRRLGFDDACPAVIIGAGRLGGALASYPGFLDYGVQILAVFDIAPQKVGLTLGPFHIQPMAGLSRFLRENAIGIAILAVPPAAAQEVAQEAAAAGVGALWNFTTTEVRVPPGVHVRHERLSVGLAALRYRLDRAPGPR